MKNTLIIIALIIVLVLGVLIFFQLRNPSGTPHVPNGNGPDGTSFPVPDDEPGKETVSLSGSSGEVLTVKNFLSDTTTVKDPVNDGYYNLGYHTFSSISKPPATPNPPYTITFVADTNFFNITLLAEPIGAYRQQAEEYLRGHLGISEADMCRLKYTLAVPGFVNENYSGSNLGFSFCPGSVPLQ